MDWDWAGGAFVGLGALGGFRFSCEQTDIRCVNTPTLKNAPRPIFRQFKNGPFSMQLDQSATVDDPQQTSTATMHERTIAAAAEQRQGVPT
jgi:hypothetical protein